MSIIATYDHVMTWAASLDVSSIISIAGACIGAIAMIGFCYQRRYLLRLETKLQRLEHDLRVINSNAIGMGQQLIQLEKRLQIMPSHSPISDPEVNQSIPQTVADNNHVYDEARDLLAKGYDVNEVAKECGLSFAEVSLLNTLARQASAV